MKRIVLLLACLVVIQGYAQAGKLYRWVDKAGIVHYSDVPVPEAEAMDPRKFSDSASPGEDMPYETRRAQQNFPVTLYVGEMCAEPCTQARSLLNKRGVPFSEKLLKTKSEIEAFQKLSGSVNSPTLAVGKTYLSGFSESAWNSELDVAGYPKTASYRQRIAPPAPPATPPAAADQTPPAEPAAQ